MSAIIEYLLEKEYENPQFKTLRRLTGFLIISDINSLPMLKKNKEFQIHKDMLLNNTREYNREFIQDWIKETQEYLLSLRSFSSEQSDLVNMHISLFLSAVSPYPRGDYYSMMKQPEPEIIQEKIFEQLKRNFEV